MTDQKHKKTETEPFDMRNLDGRKVMIGKKIVIYRYGTRNGLSVSIPTKVTISQVNGRSVLCKDSNGADVFLDIDEVYMAFVK